MSTLLTFLTWPIYTRFMSPGEFGPLAIMMSIATFYSTLLDTVVQYPIIWEEGKGKVRSALAFAMLLAMAALILMIIIFPVTMNRYQDLWLPEAFRLAPHLVWLVFLGTGLSMLVSPAQGYLRAKSRPLPYVTLSLLPVLAGIIVGLAVLYNSRSGILAVGAGLLGRGCLQALLGVGVGMSVLPLYHLRQLSEYPAKRFLAISLPYIPHMIFSQLMWNFPRWTIGVLGSPADVSFYSLANTLLRPVGMFFTAANKAWAPEIIKVDVPQRAASLRRQASMLAMIVAITGIIAVILPEGVYEAVLGSGWGGAKAYIPYMVVAVMGVGLYMFPAAVFLAEGKTHYAPFVSGLAMVVTVVLSIILGKVIGGFGVVGALSVGGLVYIASACYWVRKINIVNPWLQQTVPESAILYSLLVLAVVSSVQIFNGAFGAVTGLAGVALLLVTGVAIWRSAMNNDDEHTDDI